MTRFSLGRTGIHQIGQAKTTVLKIWRTVDGECKTLGLGSGLLHGALHAWGVVVLPVYLTTGLGVSPAFVGTVMMAGYVFQGVVVTLICKCVNLSGLEAYPSQMLA